MSAIDNDVGYRQSFWFAADTRLPVNRRNCSGCYACLGLVNVCLNNIERKETEATLGQLVRAEYCTTQQMHIGANCL